ATGYLALRSAAGGDRLVPAAVVAAGAGLAAGRLGELARLAEPDQPGPWGGSPGRHGLLPVGAASPARAGAAPACAPGRHRPAAGDAALLGAGAAVVVALVALGVDYIAGSLDAPMAGQWLGRCTWPALVFLRVGMPLALSGPAAYLLGRHLAG